MKHSTMRPRPRLSLRRWIPCLLATSSALAGIACASVPKTTDAVGRCPEWSDAALDARDRALALLAAEDPSAALHLDYQLGRLLQHCESHATKYPET